MTPPPPHDQPENLFGKIRGRFDEDAARRIDRALPEAAMAGIVAMPPYEFRRFQALFSKVFWRGPALGEVVETEANHG